MIRKGEKRAKPGPQWVILAGGLARVCLWRIAALGIVASNIRLLTKAEAGEPLPAPFYEFTACFLVLQGLQPLMALLILKWCSTSALAVLFRRF